MDKLSLHNPPAYEASSSQAPVSVTPQPKDQSPQPPDLLTTLRSTYASTHATLTLQQSHSTSHPPSVSTSHAESSTLDIPESARSLRFPPPSTSTSTPSLTDTRFSRELEQARRANYEAMKAYELALHEAVMNREVAVKEREMALKEREITTKERETIAKILEELMAIRETLIHTQAYGTGKVLLTALEEKVLGVLGGI